MKVIIGMDKKPDGRKPIRISVISCGERIVYAKMEKFQYVDPMLSEETVGMLTSINTRGKLEALRQRIREDMKK